MPTPAATLRIKRFRRKFGIAAPKVIVRSHLGWRWYVAGAVAVVILVGGLVWSLAQRGEIWEIRRQVDELGQQLREREGELQQLRASAGTELNAVQMERITQQQLLSRIRILEAENANLKEEISLFERLVPADGNESAARIEHFRVAPEGGAGRYRFRVLLAFQPSKQIREFRGRLELAAVISQGSRDEQLVIPGEYDAGGEYAIELKNFLRKEGEFNIPPGARLKTVEVRLIQGRVLKARRVAQL